MVTFRMNFIDILPRSVWIVLSVICVGFIVNSFGSLLYAAHIVAWTTKQNIIFLRLNASRSLLAVRSITLTSNSHIFFEK